MAAVLQQPAFAINVQWDNSDSPLTGPAIPYRRGDFRERAVDAVAAMFAKYPDIKFRKLRLVDRPQWGTASQGLFGEFEINGVPHLFCAGFYDGGMPQ